MSLPLSLLICLSVFQLCVGDQPVEEIITTRNVALLGGWTVKHPESEDVQKATRYAVEVFNKKSKAKKMFKLVSVNSAKFQVTAVLNFQIDTVLGKTKCSKSENHDLESCILDKKKLKCHFTVTVNPRNNEYNLQSKSCNKIGKKA
ncbi:cystatin-8 isoform 1-T2 [Anableps anableps]